MRRLFFFFREKVNVNEPLDYPLLPQKNAPKNVTFSLFQTYTEDNNTGGSKDLQRQVNQFHPLADHSFSEGMPLK